jgi:hypothetical protein
VVQSIYIISCFITFVNLSCSESRLVSFRSDFREQAFLVYLCRGGARYRGSTTPRRRPPIDIDASLRTHWKELGMDVE